MRKAAEHRVIRELPEDERPREKMIRCGAQSLSNAELIGIIIQNGSRDTSAVELGRRVLEYFDQDLTSLLNMRIEELQRNKALGLFYQNSWARSVITVRIFFAKPIRPDIREMFMNIGNTKRHWDITAVKIGEN